MVPYRNFHPAANDGWVAHNSACGPARRRSQRSAPPTKVRRWGERTSDCRAGGRPPLRRGPGDRCRDRRRRRADRRRAAELAREEEEAMPLATAAAPALGAALLGLVAYEA